MRKLLMYAFAFVVVSGAAGAQVQAPPAGQPQALPQQEPAGAGTPQLDQLRPNYVLRPGDQILIRAPEAEDISERPFRINADGVIDLPLVGKVQAGGMSVQMLESSLIESLKKFIRQPRVTVTVVQFSSDPVFFVGAFNKPGIYSLSGGRTLVETMSSIGGLQPTASRRIKVSRRKEYGAIPLASAIPVPDGSGTSVEINLASLQNSVNPAEDIVLKPFDVISVERAEQVYVWGQVEKVGEFEFQERDSMSVIQVVSMAGGLKPDADRKHARILRPIMNTSRRAEIPLNIDRILSGEENDKPLLPNDVLLIPKGNTVSWRAVRVALPVITTALSIGLLVTR